MFVRRICTRGLTRCKVGCVAQVEELAYRGLDLRFWATLAAPQLLACRGDIQDSAWGTSWSFIKSCWKEKQLDCSARVEVPMVNEE